MKPSEKMVVVLTVLSMISGGFLAAWDRYTLPKIEAFKQEQLKNSIAEVLPAYDQYTEIHRDGYTLYVAGKKDSPQPVGIAFAANGSGFQGNLAIMVGVKPDFSEIIGIKILEQLETPGLGTKIAEDPGNKKDPFWFVNQFKNLKTAPEISYIKNQKPSGPAQIQAITGATISSRCVVNILNNTIQRMRDIYSAHKIDSTETGFPK
jgi:electron transport complex protein RnfG